MGYWGGDICAMCGFPPGEANPHRAHDQAWSGGVFCSCPSCKCRPPGKLSYWLICHLGEVLPRAVQPPPPRRWWAFISRCLGCNWKRSKNIPHFAPGGKTRHFRRFYRGFFERKVIGWHAHLHHVIFGHFACFFFSIILPSEGVLSHDLVVSQTVFFKKNPSRKMVENQRESLGK